MAEITAVDTLAEEGTEAVDMTVATRQVHVHWSWINRYFSKFTVKKVNNFPVPSRDVTYLFLAWNNLIIPGQGEFGKWHPSCGGKIANLLL